MSKPEGEIRQDHLNHQIDEIKGHCSIMVNYLAQDPYTNINYNLLQIEKAIAECRSIILIYVKE